MYASSIAQAFVGRELNLKCVASDHLCYALIFACQVLDKESENTWDNDVQ